jgi:predicted ATP-binding protein involved in virulence
LYIKRLHAKNFRCFADATAEFNYPGRVGTPKKPVSSRLPNVNLFIGHNGSGKTTVFRAIALGVISPINNTGFVPDNLVRQPINPSEKTQITLDLLLSEFDTSKEELAKLKNNSISTTTTITLQGSYEDIEGDSKFKGKPLFDKIYDKDSDAFFCLAYGANRRNASSEDSQKKYKERFRNVAGIFEDHLSVVAFDNALSKMQESGFFEIICEIFNDLLPSEVQLTEKQDAKDRFLFSVKDSNNEIHIPFDALSSGYKIFAISIIGFVNTLFLMFQYKFNNEFLRIKDTYDWDIFKMKGKLDNLKNRLNRIESNKNNIAEIQKIEIDIENSEGLYNKISEIKDIQDIQNNVQEMRYLIKNIFKKMIGVVIIDELDLLMHPEWQLEVIEKLSKAFPNIQFFFSTHSPLVAGTVDPANIYILEEGDDGMEILQFKEDIYGETPNRILTSSYFNMRSIRAKGVKVPENRTIRYLEQQKAALEEEKQALLVRETAEITSA